MLSSPVLVAVVDVAAAAARLGCERVEVDDEAAAAPGDNSEENRDVDETTESLTEPESRFDMARVRTEA